MLSANQIQKLCVDYCDDGFVKRITDLSVLEICLLIAIKHHSEIYDHDPFNFEIIFTRLNKFVKSAHMNPYDRSIVLASFEKLQVRFCDKVTKGRIFVWLRFCHDTHYLNTSGAWEKTKVLIQTRTDRLRSFWCYSKKRLNSLSLHYQTENVCPPHNVTIWNLSHQMCPTKDSFVFENCTSFWVSYTVQISAVTHCTKSELISKLGFNVIEEWTRAVSEIHFQVIPR